MTVPGLPGNDAALTGIELAGTEPTGAAPVPVRRGGLTGSAHALRRTTDGSPLRLVLWDAPVAGRRAGAGLTREAAALARVPPVPSLLRVLAAGVANGGRAWLLEEDGADAGLAAPVGVDEALAAGEAAADAMGALHAAGLVHGPVADEHLRRRDGLLVLSGATLPTLDAADPDPPSTLSPPEVHAGGAWTAAADTWAVAALTWRLLHGTAHTDTVGAVRGDVAEPRHDLSGAVRTGLLAGLSPDPAARPAGPAALLDLLRGRQDRLDTTPPTDGLPTTDPARRDLAHQGRPLGSGYLLQERIGRGTTGQVWRGLRRRDGLPVAIKLLRSELAEDPEVVVRFLRERTVLVGLVHPALVQVHDLVAEEGVLAVVMDLVVGTDLRRVLTEEPLAPARALPLLGQVCAALAVVHAAGVVHRDVKPENVLVETDGRPRLADFGVARAVGGPALTRLSAVVGTPEYLAPEVASGTEPGPPSDVYAVGVMAYELLAGRRPFEGPHPAAVMRAHLQDAPRRPAGLPDPVWALVARMLDKRPQSRPTADELAGSLPALAGAARGLPARRPVPAGSAPVAVVPTAGATAPAPDAPPPPAAPLGPWVRRRALFLTVGGCVVLAATAGVLTAQQQAPGVPPQPPASPPPLPPVAVPVPAVVVAEGEDGLLVRYAAPPGVEVTGYVLFLNDTVFENPVPPGQTEAVLPVDRTLEQCVRVAALARVPDGSPLLGQTPPKACLPAIPPP